MLRGFSITKISKSRSIYSLFLFSHLINNSNLLSGFVLFFFFLILNYDLKRGKWIKLSGEKIYSWSTFRVNKMCISPKNNELLALDNYSIASTLEKTFELNGTSFCTQRSSLCCDLTTIDVYLDVKPFPTRFVLILCFFWWWKTILSFLHSFH